ncbi:TNF receptor-associated factor 4-like [Dysidea avara]|uniref:TNF receptor-associated factor 4-like n=1 Tax=Dysidea avara TaxID=196820 RepID=UPI00332F3F37
MAATSTLGGYDYDYVDVPLDTLLCKICLCPSREAQLTVCCGYTFCKSCILCASEVSSMAQKCPMCFSKGFTSVHNKQVDRLVRSFKIFCPNKKIGCEWQGEVNDIRYHINHCCFEEINCPNDCEVSVQRQNLTKHIETECVHLKVECQHCHITEEYQLIEGEHKEQCPKLPLPCPNKCDVDNIPREEMNGHRKTCPLEEINCVNKCGKTLLRKDMKDHEIECVRRKVNCRYCQITGSHRFIEGKHKKQCPKFPLPCPNKCDIGIITRGDIEEHLKMCPLETIQFQYHEVGCTEVIKRKYQEKHYTEEMEKHL